jgi:hypothetical protein
MKKLGVYQQIINKQREVNQGHLLVDKVCSCGKVMIIDTIAVKLKQKLLKHLSVYTYTLQLHAIKGEFCEFKR